MGGIRRTTVRNLTEVDIFKEDLQNRVWFATHEYFRFEKIREKKREERNGERILCFSDFFNPYDRVGIYIPYYKESFVVNIQTAKKLLEKDSFYDMLMFLLSNSNISNIFRTISSFNSLFNEFVRRALKSKENLLFNPLITCNLNDFFRWLIKQTRTYRDKVIISISKINFPRNIYFLAPPHCS